MVVLEKWSARGDIKFGSKEENGDGDGNGNGYGDGAGARVGQRTGQSVARRLGDVMLRGTVGHCHYYSFVAVGSATPPAAPQVGHDPTVTRLVMVCGWSST
jgi:hypothetical protein